MTRRAKDHADSVGSAVAVLASAVWRPFVHPWMLADPASVRHAVGQLDDHLPRLESVLARAQVDEAGAERVAGAIRTARQGLAGLADALEHHGGELRRVLRERPFALAEIRACTDALGEADAACRHGIECATRDLPSLADLLRGSPWEPTSNGARSAPGEAGGTAETPQVTAGDPATAAGPAASREALARVTTGDLPGVIARDPELLARLTDPDDPSPPGWLAPAFEDAPGSDALPGHANSLLRVARVRAACAAQTPEALTRAMLLYPRAIGELDGAPVSLRIAANRLVMRADLRRMRDRDRAFERVFAEQRARDASSSIGVLKAAVLDAWLANDEITAIATVEADRPAARRADLRALVTVTQQLLHDRVDQGRGEWGHRQVVAFSPAGLIVELWGRLDDETEQVVVYVGGTGTTVRQFGWPTNIVRALMRSDPTGHTAVVTWMGAKFPSAIGTQSPFGRFARAAAAPLRDCVEGLDVPDDVPITVVGHSYGGTIVGAAEALGLRADRVVLAGVPGVGPGVRSVADYPDTDALGRARRVTRYALTAPGDLIRVWRKGDAALSSLTSFRFAPVRTAAAWMDERVLGADPMTLPGIIELDPGIWEVDRDDRQAGEILFGPRGHADTVEPGTTSFRRICAIIRGEDPRLVEPPPGLNRFTWRPGRPRRP
ncbi:alpha/beta hydrolase [Mobilicoccus massiliensis]|uniref:alpha/beta hydrolase n=1 Tax=Mobilicoccus massiliensis TaxID=1522310 RepID=UPI00058E47B4|nr:alpha/beta hydrolase [Mobilicoccus massiliensis]